MKPFTNSHAMRTRAPFTRVLAGVFAALLTCAPSARAQDTVSDILNFLLTNRSVVTDDFERDQAALQATSDAIQNALRLEVATLPLSSSSGAFTYRLNPDLGTSERVSTNFGTFFVERAATAGRGRASFGVTFRYSDYKTLDAFDLGDGTFVTTANQFVDESQPFDQEYLRLRLETATTTAFANVGATDWLDFSVAVPVVMLRLEGERFDNFRGTETLQASANAEVAGLADMAVRAKVHLVGRRATGLAIGAELRLPTGSRDDLLGAGEVTYRGQVIGSIEGPGVGPQPERGLRGRGHRGPDRLRRRARARAGGAVHDHRRGVRPLDQTTSASCSASRSPIRRSRTCGPCDSPPTTRACSRLREWPASSGTSPATGC